MSHKLGQSHDSGVQVQEGQDGQVQPVHSAAFSSKTASFASVVGSRVASANTSVVESVVVVSVVS